MSRGWEPPAEIHSTDQIASLVKCRASTGIQPKPSKLQPLVREHKAVLVIQGPHSSFDQFRVNPMERTKKPLSIPSDCIVSSNSDVTIIPADAQLLRFTPLRSKGGDNQNMEFSTGNPKGMHEQASMGNSLCAR